jgi:hypothetical protein
MKKLIFTLAIFGAFLASKGQLKIDFQQISGKSGYLNTLKFDFEQLSDCRDGDSLIIENFQLFGEIHTIILTKFQVWNQNTIIVALGEKGEEILPFPQLVLFKGSIKEVKDYSSAYLAINKSGYATGYVELGNKTLPINRPDNMDRIEHIIDEGLDKKNINYCGAENLDSYFMDSQNIQDNIGYVVTETLLQDFVAVEMDFQCFELFDDLEEASEYPFILLGAVSLIYERDIHCHINVSYLHIWTIEDPYYFEWNELCDDDDPGGGALGQFRSYWEDNFQGISRNHAVMLAGNLAGGCAWVGHLNDSHSYAVCGIDGVIVLPIPFNDEDNWDPKVTAHEMGHNFNSTHTHCYNPPIDSCWNQEEGCYNGPIVLRNGTIMSYCHADQGISAIDMEFHSRCINEKMRPFAESKLDDLPFNLILSDENMLGHFAAINQITLSDGFSTSYYFQARIIEEGTKETILQPIYLQIEKDGMPILKEIIHDFIPGASIFPEIWAGKDASANAIQNGLYSYSIIKNGKVIEKGVITID